MKRKLIILSLVVIVGLGITGMTNVQKSSSNENAFSVADRIEI
ncbi:hypothetical protein [Bacillus paralicheniformis]|nr:hypothetical protein [Bacillus paralicheniformis]